MITSRREAPSPSDWVVSPGCPASAMWMIMRENMVTLGGLSAMYYLQQRQARDAAIDQAVGQVITLRYRLSRRWSFEAQNATDFNRASLNYRIEK